MATWAEVIRKGPTSFCPTCGAYLILSDSGDITCDVCATTIKESAFKYDPLETTSSKYRESGRRVGSYKMKEILPTGAVVYEQCPRCGNDRMHFHSAQVRSVDEGQTVYYECPNCGYHETVNT